MHNLQMLHENIFRGDAEERPSSVDNLLNSYEILSIQEKKEFINLFFNEQVYSTTILDTAGSLLIVLREEDLSS